MIIDESMFGQKFVQNSNDPAFLKEASENLTAWSRETIREDAICERILTSDSITPAECDRAEGTDGTSDQVRLKKIFDREYVVDNTGRLVPPTLRMSFRGGNHFGQVNTRTYAVEFEKILTPTLEVNTTELLAKKQPLLANIKRHLKLTVGDVKDATFFSGLAAAIAAANAAAPSRPMSFVSPDTKILPDNLTKLINLLEGLTNGYQRLDCDCLLMHKTTFNQVNTWQQSGVDNGAGTELWENGFSGKRLLGKKLYLTNKEQFVPEGTVFAFASREFLGKHLRLTDEQFSIERKRDMLFMEMWMHHGMTLQNIFAVAKMTLTAPA